MSTPMFFSETLLPEKPSSHEEKDKFEGGPPTRVSSANRVRARRNRHQRKKQRTSSPPDYEDFLVFGYEAKAFRDDEMAKKINDGELLIPWRGEETTENRILLD
ncbi:5178_t:CDS:1, partial [Ambispora leptoticha]